MRTQLRKKGTRGFSLCVGVALLLAYGCGAAVEEQDGAGLTNADIQADALQTAIPVLPVEPAVSINAVMVAQVDHASHVLWDVAREGMAPQTEKDWMELEHHATQLAAAGSWVALGGAGEADPGWVRLPNWKMYAQELTDAAVMALDAAQSQNLDAVLKAGDALVESCERCHTEFKPDLPSEGIVHPH